jgi:hypothetical protein
MAIPLTVEQKELLEYTYGFGYGVRYGVRHG